jgi:hypothetical protein
MTVANRIIEFNDTLIPPLGLPKSVITMNPYTDTLAKHLSQQFYTKYYDDNQSRKVLFGINPGRFGGGITGVPFTDPIRLQSECGIENTLDKRSELSSIFMYEMINAFGGSEKFYSQFYFSAISPLGFVQNGKNLNYYDIPNYKKLFEEYATECILKQLDFPLDRSIAYCIGQGQNLKFLEYLNAKNGFFDQIISLPHPRWVMQYRLKTKEVYIDEYLTKLI